MKRFRGEEADLVCKECGSRFDDEMELVIHVSLHGEGDGVPSASPVFSSFRGGAQDESFVELAKARVGMSGFQFCDGKTRLFCGKERWGSCGYRNTQTLLCSAGFAAGKIEMIQKQLVEAWARGFDAKSARDLGGDAIVGSTKWIGACECLTLVRDLTKRRAFILELEKGNSKNFDGTALIRFFSDWFGGESAPLPVMVQWKGHSVVVCGFNRQERAAAVWDPNKAKLTVRDMKFFSRGTLHLVCVERIEDDAPLGVQKDMGFRARRDHV